MRTAAITHLPIEPESVLQQVGAAGDGAVVLFLGTVRDSSGGQAVTGMQYDLYEAMAREVLEAIVAEAAEQWGVEHLVAVHRVGHLSVGEVSAAIAVSSPHRAEAFAASRQVIEQIKLRLPVWKQEHYATGAARWVPGAVPLPEEA
jgi:molybdopterin synthase catalytic subunit